METTEKQIELIKLSTKKMSELGGMRAISGSINEKGTVKNAVLQGCQLMRNAIVLNDDECEKLINLIKEN